MYNHKIYMQTYRIKNKDKIRAYNKLYLKKHIKSIKAYRAKHSLKLRLYMKKYYRLHKNRMDFRNKLWNQSIKGKEYKRNWWRSASGKLSHKLDSARRRIGTKDLTSKLISQIYKENKKKFGVLTCYLCLKPIRNGQDELEHKVPISRGGGNNKGNLALSCKHCNCSKGNKTVKEFKQGRNYV